MPRNRRHGLETAADMARSMGLVLVVVAFVVVLVNGGRPEPDPVRAVDFSAAARAAAAKIPPFVVARPDAAPAGWRATSARLRDGAGGVVTWELGFVTGGEPERYVGLQQVGGPADAVDAAVADLLEGFVADGTSRVAGRAWERLVAAGGEPPERVLLWRPDAGEAVLLLTTGDEALLAELAGRLP